MFDCATPTITQTLASAATRSTDGAGSSVDGFDAAGLVPVTLDVTAAAGRPERRFAFVIEESADEVAWTPRASLEARGPGRQAVILTGPLQDNLRARWAIAGTDSSATFSVTAKGI